MFLSGLKNPTAGGGPYAPLSVFRPGLWIFLTFCFAEEDVENFDVTNLSQDMLRSIEADSFWCMSKLLDGIQVSRPPSGRAQLLPTVLPCEGTPHPTPARAPLPVY